MATWQNPTLPPADGRNPRLRPVLVDGAGMGNMQLFQQITATQKRSLRSFVTSYSLEIVGIILLAHFGVTAPQVLAPRTNYTHVELYVPKPAQAPQQQRGRSGMRDGGRLGVTPEFRGAGQEGVVISQVAEDSPAARHGRTSRAGLDVGDQGGVVGHNADGSQFGGFLSPRS